MILQIVVATLLVFWLVFLALLVLKAEADVVDEQPVSTSAKISHMSRRFLK